MIIDIHAHAAGKYDSVDSIKNTAKKYDIGKVVYELRKQLPDFIIQFLWVNPLDALQMVSLENNIRMYQPKGIKLHQAWNPFEIDSVEFKNMVDISCSYKLPDTIKEYIYSLNAKRILSI